MKILRGILSDSKEYYKDIERRITAELAKLPNGSVKERLISGRKYYYLQRRVGGKVVHKYIGRKKPVELIAQIRRRRQLQAELKRVRAALVILKKAEGKKRG